MRIGLIAALRRTEDGTLRAALPLAGRSVLVWQARMLASLGVERVLCLSEDTTASAELLRLQHALEAKGMQFHVLKGFAAIPALVRAEDDLIVLLDGLVPDQEVLRSVLDSGGAIKRLVVAMPADHALAVACPADFERIDSARHWAGVLAMRGAPVQHLADFPEDADAGSLLLRLALQSGTAAFDLAQRELVPETWFLADSQAAVEQHANALIAGAAPSADWRAPSVALALTVVRRIAPRGLARGGLMGGGLAVGLMLGAVMIAFFGFPATGLGMAALGAFVAEISQTFAALDTQLQRGEKAGHSAAVMSRATDGFSALVLWFALVPWPDWLPLAVLGPVLIGLARLVSRTRHTAIGAAASDRASLLLILALASVFGVLPEAMACLALGLLAALLLRSAPD
ncbi:MAG: hypothetical protein EAY70_11950 [Sphingomonadales bacterium]|nr:MAG: hypothetical protein EAY70_11950 [Sphingomonadales bacterium]